MTDVSKNLKYFAERFPAADSIQLVHNLRQEEDRGGIHLKRAGEWLAGLPA